MTTTEWTIHVQTHENEPAAAISIPAGISVSDFLASCGQDVERLAVLANPTLPVFKLADGGIYRLVTGRKRRRLEELDPEMRNFVNENFVAKSLFDNFNNKLDTVNQTALNLSIEIKDSQSACREKQAKINQLMLERVQVLKDASSLYQRGIVELQLKIFMGAHVIDPKNPNEFQCKGQFHPKTFPSAMKHWRHCDKLGGKLNILTHFSQGLLTFSAEPQRVEACLDDLYGAFSSTMHVSIGVEFPITVIPFQDDAMTLALLTFLGQYAIPFVVAAEGESEVPLPR